MSRLFDDGANEYLEIDQAVVSGVPLSICGWMYSNDLTIDQALLFVGDKDVATEYHCVYMRGAVAGDFVQAISRGAVGGINRAVTTTGFSVNTWHHVAGVFAASDDRAALIDGGSKGTNAVNTLPVNFDRTSIGRFGDSTPIAYMSGRLAEAVVLRIAATDYQVWLHAQGVPAPVVWPGWAIAAYYPLFETDRDFHTSIYNMAPFNTPGWAPHPPKVLAWWRKYMRGGTT